MYAPGSKRLTPVMRQYREAKEAFPEAILFFRLGDFYEMFNDDAVVAARELQLTLTSRSKGSPQPVPMAGVPYHAAHSYIAKLIARGFQVAICEQLGDPTKIKGLVPRKVVRVVTPALTTDSDQLDAGRNNFLFALDHEADAAVADGGTYGIALLDVSTGELSAGELGSAGVLAELSRADPREVVLDPLCRQQLGAALAAVLPRAALREDRALDSSELSRLLDEGVAAPLYADAVQHHSVAALRAAARALRYARRYLPETTLPVRRLARHDPQSFLLIDEAAQRHLELVQSAAGERRGSLLGLIDLTVTAGGARLLHRRLLAPLVEVGAIRRRLDIVELLVNHPRARQELRAALEQIRDIERLAVRASLGESTPRDLGALRDSLAAAPAALGAILAIPPAPDAGDEDQPAASPRERLVAGVDLLPDLAELLSRALTDQPPARATDGGIFRPGYDEALDELAGLRRSGTELIVALESKLRAETDISSLKVKYTRAFGWYVEITRANLDKVPEDFRRKQSLTGAERYSNDELDDLADKLIHAEQRHSDREAELFAGLVAEVAGRAEALQALAATVARWDVGAALSEVAHRYDYNRPQIDDGGVLRLEDARHPVVERSVTSGRFVPNDTVLDPEGERLLLITGPNMAGKSTLMRQIALCTILAQMGSYIPARAARIGVVDRVLSRVGASDNLARGESTFMVEMRETASILRSATRRSLVILDEIGRGTSTYDGLAIAWAVAEFLHRDIGCRALMATHYHQLTDLADYHEGIANYSVSAREHGGDIVFLHRLSPGSVSRSFGVAVARLAGLPEVVLARSRAILAGLEEGTNVPGGPRVKAEPSAGSQLDLFKPTPEKQAAASVERATCDALRNADVDKLTPLEALQLVHLLKKQLTS